MASRPKQAEPRPAPRLYLITPAGIDAAELRGAIEAADIAAVLLRLGDGDERSLINRVKAAVPIVQDKGAALLLDGHPELVARGVPILREPTDLPGWRHRTLFFRDPEDNIIEIYAEY